MAATVSLILWGSSVLLLAAALLIALLGLWEFYRLCEAAGVPPIRIPGYLLALAFCLLFLAERGAPRTLPFAPSVGWVNALAALAFGAALWLGLSLLPGWGGLRLLRSPRFATLLGPAYISIPLYLLVWVREQHGPWLLLFGLAVIWAGDTAGYFIGKSFGKHKSSPLVSPNKTWEGTFASFAASLLVALLAVIGFRYGRFLELLALAAALNVAGQLGDLAESALKRSAGVKDSSNLVPGHGGVLDRIDAMLFAAPVLWYYGFWFTS